MVKSKDPKALKDDKKTSKARPYKTRVVVTLMGTSPILFNPSTPQLVRNLIAGHNPGKDTRPVEEQAESKLLKNDQGFYFVPRDWVFACIREAGRDVGYKTARDKITSNTKGTKLPALLHLEHDHYVIHDGQGSPVTDWATDCRKGNNTNAGKGAGVAVGIVRARFDLPWAIDIEATIRTDRIDLNRIVELMTIAGNDYGLGDGRPGKGKLGYGMFEVARFKIIGIEAAPPRLVIEGLEKMMEGDGDFEPVAANAAVQTDGKGDSVNV